TESGEFQVAANDILRDGMILLDEIENGINPYLTEQIVYLLRNLVEKTRRQVIVTTHSPVILNEFKPEEIVFLWKDKNGAVHSKKMFSTGEMKSLLKALNPGEVWINLEKKDILEKLSSKKERKK
ncbi:MAG: ATP-binding protein, partial [Treponema sp.]|nr:ATP-binding protein [Treponema sp.]